MLFEKRKRKKIIIQYLSRTVKNTGISFAKKKKTRKRLELWKIDDIERK